jgi:Protein of unknown function (DUF2501)
MIDMGFRGMVTGLLLIAISAGTAQAQLLDQLKGAVGGGGVPSVGQASPSNTAGVLQYCIQNKYVGAGDSSSVKNSLLSKVPGQTSDSGYQQGSSGLLQTGNGQNYSLGGDGVKAQLTQKVCEQVLQHAKSLL